MKARAVTLILLALLILLGGCVSAPVEVSESNEAPASAKASDYDKLNPAYKRLIDDSCAVIGVFDAMAGIYDDALKAAGSYSYENGESVKKRLEEYTTALGEIKAVAYSESDEVLKALTELDITEADYRELFNLQENLRGGYSFYTAMLADTNDAAYSYNKSETDGLYSELVDILREYFEAEICAFYNEINNMFRLLGEDELNYLKAEYLAGFTYYKDGLIEWLTDKASLTARADAYYSVQNGIIGRMTENNAKLYMFING